MAMGSGSPLDTDAIVDSSNVFLNTLGEYVRGVKFKNSRGGVYESVAIAPREVRLTIAPGIYRDGGYVDIQWWKNGDYKYHYREDGLEFRFGREEDNTNVDRPVRHFHPPEAPAEHRPSCIDAGHPPERVTLAVIACWYGAAKESDHTLLNSRTNPP